MICCLEILSKLNANPKYYKGKDRISLQNFFGKETIPKKAVKIKTAHRKYTIRANMTDYNSNNVDTIREYKNKNYGWLININKYQIH